MTAASFMCIVAHTRNRVIGKSGSMPWHLSSDLKRFRALTTGRAVVMGRRTFESLRRPLPERRNIVLSRSAGFAAAGCEMVHGFDELPGLSDGEAYRVIGGADIYRQILPRCHEIFLTEIQADIDGDAFFPEIDRQEWRWKKLGEHPVDERNDYAAIFWHLVREAKPHNPWT